MRGSESIAKKHWEAFEKLAVEFIKSTFSIEPDLAYITQPSKDGGFDGRFTHEIATNEEVGIRHETLLEAKLRSGSATLGLRDFAATIVIAFNVAAHTLVIVSNHLFSPQALCQAKRFSEKTNMQIILVNGPTLSGWIRQKLKALRGRYPKQLLEFLIVDDPSEEKYRREEITSRCEDNYESQRASFIELGWRENGEIAPCRITVEPPTQFEGELDGAVGHQQIIGERRRNTADRLLSILQERAGLAVLSGTAGVGKSFVVNTVLHRLHRSGFTTVRIDMASIFANRQLFLKVFAALIGDDVLKEVAQGAEVEKLEQLLQVIGGKPAGSDIQKTVALILKESYSKFKRRSDIHTDVLLDFLEIAITPHARRRRPIITFENLNRCSDETLEFLHPMCHRLAKAGVTVLIELRSGGDEPAVTLERWHHFLKLFEHAADLGRFDVSALLPEEAEHYLCDLLPGLGVERASVIRERVGLVPLFLRSAALWLKEQGVVEGVERGATLITDLETYFEGINPDDALTILHRHIDLWYRRTEELPYAKCIAAAVLFGGHLTLDVLGTLAPDKNKVDLADHLVKSGLFTRVAGQPHALAVCHDLMLEAMRKITGKPYRSMQELLTTEDDRTFRLVDIAETLYPVLKDLFADSLTQNLRDTDLLAAQGSWEAVYSKALKLGRELAEMRQWSESARYLGLAYLAARELPDQQKIIAEINSLIEYLEIEDQRYRLGLSYNLHYVKGLVTRVKTAPERVEAHPKSEEVRLRTLNIEWRAAFIREKFQEALEIAKHARDFALQCSSAADPDVRGQAVANYGVNLKAIDQREQSLNVFDEGIRAIPESLKCRVAMLSNIAAHNLMSHPARALEHYREIQSLTDRESYPFLTVLHVHVDVAMALFLMQEYEESKRNAEDALALAYDNGIPAQEARARNILGCCYWVSGSTEAADRQFDLAELAAERTLSHRFLWRMRTNRAGSALELDLKDIALEHARSAQRLITQPRQPIFEALAHDTKHFKSRWYVALLALAKYYHELEVIEDLDRILHEVALPHFPEHARAIIVGNYLPEVFENTTHLHAGRIMITG